MRIARALALAGIAARRKCEAFILEGLVTVNGETVLDLGRQVEPDKDEIRFRGKPLSSEQPVYFMLHKPVGYTTTVSDPHAEKTVIELLPPEIKARLFPVGRLDRDSTGLLLFTNDGDLANRLTHPRYGVGKWYEVTLDRPLDPAARARVLRGVRLEEGPARAEKVEAVSARTVRLLLREGRKREIRRIFQQVGYKVEALCRTDFGPLKLGNLPPAKGRLLTPAEVAHLKRLSAPSV
ncbi:MAG: pseudouridine synthase [Candidatus Omnitrophota bacterium]|nr:pseudouridine synthase [Candidatus Omnitrophota bacterium]